MDYGPEKTRGPLGDAAILVAAAAAFRLAFMLAMPRVVDTSDAIHYIELARKYAAGEFFGFQPRLPILLSALGALAGQTIPDMEWACRMVSFVASALVVLPVYALSVRMHGRGAARVAGLAVALWPWLADYGCRVAPEALASLLWFAAAYALLRAVRDGGAWTVLAPLAYFGLHLTRPEGIVLLLAAPVGAAAILCLRASDARSTRLLPYVALGAVLLLLYALYMRQVLGAATISARINEPDAALRHLAAHRDAVGRALLRLFSEVLPVMIGPYLLLFAGVGLFRPATGGRDLRLEAFLLYLAAVQVACAALSTYAEPRYVMNPVIVAALWAARGISEVARQAAANPRTRPLRALPVAGLLALMAVSAAATLLPEHMGRLPREPREYKIAGRWMRDHLEPGLILCRKPEVGFYADMPSTGPASDDTIEAAVARARAAGARYLVVDERYSTAMVPGLLPLLDPANAPPSLRLLRADLSPYPSGRVVVYEVLTPPGEEGSPGP